jgi:hypothetical protein
MSQNINTTIRHLDFMHHKPLIILLLLAVSFQSISAVADVHQSHQSGVEHLEFEHDHDSEPEIKTDDESRSFDCHHCCHCHGGHVSSFLHRTFNLVFLELDQSIQIYGQSFQKGVSSRLLRPPQA